ncbi:hypothetical protein BJ878DRAFT_417821 [Calycina marina]|uniref:F-box domain-containing protein n=1 Tax=Calycina marina TaxID=1763456 RepID=A0A9P8CGB1_9HELO|nr:hypothetical protein BJ878DRAFT_417821 [Calycina marina]
MSYQGDHSLQVKKNFTSRLATALRPKKRGNRLTKTPPGASVQVERKSDVSNRSTVTQNSVVPNRPPGLPAAVNFYNKSTPASNAQTGELWDEAEMLHSLLRRDSQDSLNSLNRVERIRNQIPDSERKPGEDMIASLPATLWQIISSHMTPIDSANLALSSKTLLSLLGTSPFLALNFPKNNAETHWYKIGFLLGMDIFLPDHLLCYPCATYHRRIQKGKERLKARNVLNLIYNCPNPKLQSRHRLTVEYELPFTFVQLVFRAQQYRLEYGLQLETLSRRLKSRESEWFHQTRYFFHKGHLLLRVISKSFAVGGLPPAGLRNFLYSREDYTPYFSVCAHWRDGELMNVCKCALSHVPLPDFSAAHQLRNGQKTNRALIKSRAEFVSLCSNCRPMRRCPDCPTEYLVEMKLEEDRSDSDPVQRFKQCMVVTRWSDLGDGRNPAEGEWAACNGEIAYDSFAHMGRRAIAGVFESQNGFTVPGQGIKSLNPKGERRGEEGHNWY